MPMPRPLQQDPIAAAPLTESLRALARRGVVSHLRKGAQIITEGDRGDTLYILLSGRLRAYSVGPDDKQVTYAVHGPGEYVGEMGLDGGLRSAHVETLQASVCVVVSRATLERHLAEDPGFAFELLSRVIRRARMATQGMRQFALVDVYGRLKDLLERQAQGSMPFVWDPAPSHKEMSQMLGCTPAMVTIVLGELRKGSYVKIGRRQLVLLRPLPMNW